MKLLLKLAVLLLLSSACNKVETTASKTMPGDFVHAVYFWMANPDNTEEREAFEKSLFQFLDASEFIVTSHVGTPAATTHRDVVDGSYTYSLVLTFKNAEDEAGYQKEDVHLKFIEESQHLWTKVLVYDSENILN